MLSTATQAGIGGAAARCVMTCRDEQDDHDALRQGVTAAAPAFSKAEVALSSNLNPPTPNPRGQTWRANRHIPHFRYRSSNKMLRIVLNTTQTQPYTIPDGSSASAGVIPARPSRACSSLTTQFHATMWHGHPAHQRRSRPQPCPRMSGFVRFSTPAIPSCPHSCKCAERSQHPHAVGTPSAAESTTQCAERTQTRTTWATIPFLPPPSLPFVAPSAAASRSHHPNLLPPIDPFAVPPWH